jgi:hypothetical protein
MTINKTLFAFAAIAALAAGNAVWGSSHGQGQGHGRGQPGAMMEFVQEWDMNEDGRVTPDDLTERRGMLFEMFDLDGDGGIDGAEQANMAQTIAGQMESNHGAQGRGNGQGGGHGRGGPGQMIHNAMTAAYADADGDGVLSIGEWADATQRLWAKLDRNGDGQLDRDDFRGR